MKTGTILCITCLLSLGACKPLSPPADPLLAETQRGQPELAAWQNLALQNRLETSLHRFQEALARFHPSREVAVLARNAGYVPAALEAPLEEVPDDPRVVAWNSLDVVIARMQSLYWEPSWWTERQQLRVSNQILLHARMLQEQVRLADELLSRARALPDNHPKAAPLLRYLGSRRTLASQWLGGPDLPSLTAPRQEPELEALLRLSPAILEQFAFSHRATLQEPKARGLHAGWQTRLALIRLFPALERRFHPRPSLEGAAPAIAWEKAAHHLVQRLLPWLTTPEGSGQAGQVPDNRQTAFHMAGMLQVHLALDHLRASLDQFRNLRRQGAKRESPPGDPWEALLRACRRGLAHAELQGALARLQITLGLDLRYTLNWQAEAFASYIMRWFDQNQRSRPQPAMDQPVSALPVVLDFTSGFSQPEPLLPPAETGFRPVLDFSGNTP